MKTHEKESLMLAKSNVENSIKKAKKFTNIIQTIDPKQLKEVK